MGSFSYTSRSAFIFIRGVSLTNPVLASVYFNFIFDYLGSFSYTSRAAFFFLAREFLLHILCWLRFCFVFCLFLFFVFLPGEFLLHISCWIYFSVGSFSYTSIADSFLYGEFSYTSLSAFIFIQGVSLTHPLFASFFKKIFLIIILSGEFLLHIPCWFRFLLGEFLLHIPYWVHFYLGSFSYTSHAGFIFIVGVSLTHPVLAFFSFLFFFYMGSFF